MEIWNGAAASDQVLSQMGEGERTVATIGIFDGVHRGHQRILKNVVERAHNQNERSVAITFDPHPSHIHRPEAPAQLIQPLEDRLTTIAALGIDVTWVVPYDWELAKLSPEQFVERYFVDVLHASDLVVGSDTRFGAGNAGNIETLRKLGRVYDFNVIEVADVCNVRGGRYSSTWVRSLLREGRVKEAAKVLGRNYRLRGVVEKGFQRGRLLGFPTANLGSTEGLVVPADGVYAGLLVRSVPGTDAVEHLPAAISVGTNPQFDGQKTTVEAHVLGRADLNLYGDTVAIDFRDRLRPMMKLDTVAALQDQMDEDLLHSAEVLGVPPATRVDPAKVTAQ